MNITWRCEWGERDWTLVSAKKKGTGCLDGLYQHKAIV